MGIKNGDRIFLTEAEDGSFRLAPYDPTFERQMKLAGQIMHDDRDLLHAWRNDGWKWIPPSVVFAFTTSNWRNMKDDSLIRSALARLC